MDMTGNIADINISSILKVLSQKAFIKQPITVHLEL